MQILRIEVNVKQRGAAQVRMHTRDDAGHLVQHWFTLAAGIDPADQIAGFVRKAQAYAASVSEEEGSEDSLKK